MPRVPARRTPLLPTCARPLTDILAGAGPWLHYSMSRMWRLSWKPWNKNTNRYMYIQYYKHPLFSSAPLAMDFQLSLSMTNPNENHRHHEYIYLVMHTTQEHTVTEWRVDLSTVEYTSTYAYELWSNPACRSSMSHVNDDDVDDINHRSMIKWNLVNRWMNEWN